MKPNSSLAHVIERAARDPEFNALIAESPNVALQEYDLTPSQIQSLSDCAKQPADAQDAQPSARRMTGRNYLF